MRKLTAHPLLSFTFAAIIGSTLSAVANANPVKILPIGDSITQGTKGEQSYRKPLTQELDLISCSYEMVGSRLQTNRPSLEPIPVFESPHEGYSGHAVDDFLNATISNGIQNPGINSIMDSETPDVILLHIGSNDMTRSQPVQGNYNSNGTGGTIAEIDLLATRIWNKNPNAEILIANVIPWFGGSNNPNIGSDVEDLGDAIEAWVSSENDSRLHLVDVRSNYLSSYMNADGIHPNQNGDAHIADAFLQAIEDNSLCPEGFPPATFISSPSVAGELLPLTHTFTGTATDQGGSGFDRVRIAIEDDNHTDTTDRWYNFSSGTFGTFDSKNATLTNVTTASLDWEVTATMPGGGSYTIYALAIDNEGNQDYDGPPALWPTNRSFTVANDTTPPNTFITTPTAGAGAAVQSPVNFTGTATDTGGAGFGRVELRLRNLTTQQWYDFDTDTLGSTASLGVANLSNTTNAATDWNLNSLPLPDGAYRLWAIAIDGQDNIDLVSGARQWVTRDFTVAPPDTTAPSTNILTPAAGSSVQSNVTLSGTATDAGGAGFGRVELRLRNLTTLQWYDFNNNSIGNTATIGTANLSNTTATGTDWDLAVSLPDGAYRLWAIAIDAQDNIDLASGVRQWVRQDFTVAPADSTAPATTITTPASGASVQSPVNIAGTATDTGGAGFGRVELRLRNLTTAQWYNFSTATLGTTASIGFATLSNTTTNATDWNVNLALPDGKYRVWAIAIDANDNVAVAGSARQWVIRDFTVEFPDNVAPVTTITTPASNAILQNPINISGSATDAGGAGFGRVELRLRNITAQQWYNFTTGSLGTAASLGVANLSNTTTNSTDWNVNLALPDGRYRVQAIAIDADGNIPMVGTARQWSIREFDVLPQDSAAPVTTITTPAQDDILQSPINITGTATDTGGAGFGRVELRLRNLTTQQWYNFNTGALGTAASLGIATLSNTTNAATDWSVNANLPDGRYRIQAIAIDSQGNIDIVSGARQWVVHEFHIGPLDSIAPDTVITTPASSGDILQNAFTVSGTATDQGGSGFDRVELLLYDRGAGLWYNFNTGSFGSSPVLGQANLSNTSTNSTDWTQSFTLADGSYRVQAIAYDSAGNKKETGSGAKQWVIHYFEVE